MATSPPQDAVYCALSLEDNTFARSKVRTGSLGGSCMTFCLVALIVLGVPTKASVASLGGSLNPEKEAQDTDNCQWSQKGNQDKGILLEDSLPPMDEYTDGWYFIGTENMTSDPDNFVFHERVLPRPSNAWTPYMHGIYSLTLKPGDSGPVYEAQLLEAGVQGSILPPSDVYNFVLDVTKDDLLTSWSSSHSKLTLVIVCFPDPKYHNSLDGFLNSFLAGFK